MIHGLQPFCVDHITIWKDDVMIRLLCRRPDLHKIVGITLIYCTIGFAFSPPVFCAPAPTPEVEKLAIREKEKLVQKAVAHYEQKEIDKAKEDLEKASTVFPENYAVPYYLGLIYLEQGNRQGAIAQWQQYVKLDPQSENALIIRKNITILLREQAQEFAKQAVARETKLAGVAGARGDDRTIAIANFNNLGSEKFGPLGKGIASMLIADLSHISDLIVVDRIKIQALIEEMKLGKSGLVNINTAPKVGKLLRAKHVTSGTLADIDEERLMIASAVVNADENTSVGAQEVKGVLKEFYDMEKLIACQILEDLGRNCDAVPAAFNKIHTKSMPALVAYSWGLDHVDKGNYDKAREEFQKAIDEDPQFDLAIAALLATPPSSMASMDESQMISNATSSGPSSAVAGTAVAGSTAATVATSAFSISPMKAIIGGVAIIGGGAALAGGGGGGGGGGPGPQPASTLSLTGDWKGTWDAGNEATFSLTETDGSVTGTVSIVGDACLTTGSVTGTVAGSQANLTIQSDGETVALDGATINSSDKTLSGQLQYRDSASTECMGKTGNFSVTLTTGGADIDW
jgi:tetratricopeptide (TPR) repeat protein